MRKEFKIGIFAVVILAVAYWGINFLKGRDLFNRSNTYYAYYDDVGGIQMSSPVIIKGVNAGMVTGIKYRPDLGGDVEIMFDVRSEYDIPVNSVAKLFSNGIMGGKAIEIELGDAADCLPEGATIRSVSESGLLDMASGDVGQLIRKLDRVAGSLDVTLTSINAILDDNSGRIAGLFDGLSRGAEAIGDKGEAIGAIIDDVNAVTGALAANAGQIDTAMVNLRTVSDELAAADLAATVEGLNDALTQLNGVLAMANSRDGSLGLLLNDTALYDSLASASSNLSALLADLKQNPKRYVHFSLFGRKE